VKKSNNFVLKQSIRLYKQNSNALTDGGVHWIKYSRKFDQSAELPSGGNQFRKDWGPIHISLPSGTQGVSTTAGVTGRVCAI
jgi:hypothetical protein